MCRPPSSLGQSPKFAQNAASRQRARPNGFIPTNFSARKSLSDTVGSKQAPCQKYGDKAIPTMEQLLHFERKGHLCLRQFFSQTQVQALEPLLMQSMDLNMLNAFRHRISVLCPGIDPFSVKTVKQAENLISSKVHSSPCFCKLGRVVTCFRCPIPSFDELLF